MRAWACVTSFSRRALIAATLALGAAPAGAYPSFVGYGHASCQLCHFNSAGGGIMTDYGRAVMASQIAARPPGDEPIDDERLAELSGALGSTPMPSWLRAQIDYVGVFEASDLQADTDTDLRTDVADLSLVVRPSEYFWTSLRGGYEFDPVDDPNGYPRSRFISREHYLAVAPARGWRAYAGFMDIAYGLRTGDNFSFARSQTGLGGDAQTYGALVHYAKSAWDVSAHAFLGNVLLDPKQRWKGVALSGEACVGEGAYVGASLMSSRTSARNRLAGAVTGRFGLIEGSSVLGEVGVVRESVEGAGSELGSYISLQTSGRIARGYHFSVLSEVYTPRLFDPAPRYLRLGPMLQAFVVQRVELRAQVLMTRVLGTAVLQEDTMDAIGQVHIWF